MSYNIKLLYSNDEIKIYKTSTGLWFTLDKKSGKISFITEQEAIEMVHGFTGDMDQTCKELAEDKRGGRDEYNQMLALILSQLNPWKAAKVLSELPEDVQTDVAIRIAFLDKTSPADISVQIASMREISPEQVKEIESTLDYCLNEGNLMDDLSEGIKTIASILEQTDISTRESILSNIEKESSELAVRLRNNQFVFEDLLIFDDRGIQLILREVDIKELVVALKGASNDLKEFIFRNISSRVKKMIEEEMDYAGPIRWSVVEEAQRRIIEIVRRLEEEQQIVIVRGDPGGEIFV